MEILSHQLCREVQDSVVHKYKYKCIRKSMNIQSYLYLCTNPLILAVPENAAHQLSMKLLKPIAGALFWDIYANFSLKSKSCIECWIESGAKGTPKVESGGAREKIIFQTGLSFLSERKSFREKSMVAFWLLSYKDLFFVLWCFFVRNNFYICLSPTAPCVDRF